MDFVRDILRELKGKKEIPPEILELIRPSVALLDLGLPIDVLYEHCRWSIRDLLRRVHPDPQKGVVAPALQTLSDAFNLIKDQEVFAEALVAAREYRGYQRLGERSLRGRIQGLQDDIANLNARSQRQETAHQGEIARLTDRFQANVQDMRNVLSHREAFFQKQESDIRFGQWFRSYLAGQMMRFSSASTSIRPITGYMQLAVASFAFSFSAAPDPNRKEDLYQQYGDGTQKGSNSMTVLSKEKSSSLRDFIGKHNLAATPVSELFERAKASGFAAPALRWSFRHARRELNLTRMGGTEPAAVVQDSPLEGWTEAMSEKYRAALEHLAKGLAGLYVDHAAIIPQRITIEDQIFHGDAVSRARLYVLGTVDPEIGLSHHRTSSSETPHPRLQVSDEILPEVEPFVCPGRAIIVVPGSDPFVLRHQLPDTDEWSRLMKKKTLMAQSKTIPLLSHIILDVE